MEEILKRIVTVRKTILICFHLYYLRLLASELAMKSSSEKDSFRIFVCVCVIFLIKIIVLREKVRKKE